MQAHYRLGALILTFAPRGRSDIRAASTIGDRGDPHANPLMPISFALMRLALVELAS